MAERKTATKTARKPTRAANGARKSGPGFSAEERAAMKERLRELKAGAEKVEGESAVQAAIAAMSPQDRVIGARIHEIVKAAAPDLVPRTWYGMPAYAKDGKIVCFFRNAGKFKERYAMFGFNDSAKLDQGSIWPIAFAVTELTRDVESKIAALVKKAVR